MLLQLHKIPDTVGARTCALSGGGSRYVAQFFASPDFRFSVACQLAFRTGISISDSAK